ncbi:MAG: zinc ribbon domain-containing protein [Thermoplasmata archaeon]
MVKCPVCGTENPDNSTYCLKCGYRFSDRNTDDINKELIKDNKINKKIESRDESYIHSMLAFAFSIISFIVFSLLAIHQIIVISMILTVISNKYYISNFSELYMTGLIIDLIYILIFLTFAFGSLIVFLRNYRIYARYQSNEFRECHSLITEGTIILSIIFGLIFTGLFLIFLKFDLERIIKNIS